jgi:hypothetical protein
MPTVIPKHVRLVLLPLLECVTHSFPLQLEYNPRMIKGSGLEDHEGCERFWSVLNRCSRSTRNATRFNRGEIIERFTMNWNSERSAGLSKHLSGDTIC